MSFLFRVNGAERNDFVRYRSLQIRKDGAHETARLEFMDRDTSASTFQVYDGDTLHISQDGGLEFGGEVQSIRVQRLDRSARGIVITTVDAKGWRFEAEDIVVTVAFPAQTLLQTVEALRLSFLAAKGWTSLNTVTGGPSLPALTFTRQNVATIFDELQKRSGWPWRVNGDRQMGFIEPGTLVYSEAFSDTDPSIVLTGLSWARDRLRYATRVVATTGGSGNVSWTDRQNGNGAWRVFPLSVFPAEKFPPTQVVEGSTTHQIGGGRWTYDANDALVVATTPVANGTQIAVTYGLDMPATVRVYDPTTRAASGAWNYAAIIDAQISASEQTDIAQALSWTQAELQSRRANPKRVELSTFSQGLYPWMRTLVSFTEHAINGYFLIQSSLLTDVGVGRPRMDLSMLEGDVLGRDWTAYFKERSGSSSGGSTVSTGGGTPPTGGGGAAGLPSGTTFRLAGDNVTPYGVGTTFIDAPQACPIQLGGTGMAGTWTLRVPAYLLAAGTLEVQLWNQTAAQQLALVSTTQVGVALVGPFAYLSTTFAAPANVSDVLLRMRVVSGSNQAVIGHATIVKA